MPEKVQRVDACARLRFQLERCSPCTWQCRINHSRVNVAFCRVSKGAQSAAHQLVDPSLFGTPFQGSFSAFPTRVFV